MKESDFLTKYARCSGSGHEERTCSSDTVVLAIELPMSEGDLAVDAEAFVAKKTGQVESDGRGRSQEWRTRQAGRAIYR